MEESTLFYLKKILKKKIMPADCQGGRTLVWNRGVAN
jgi:hypothetical protein